MGRETPHARPKACLDLTNTYGTFLSSQSIGMCKTISNGSASAAIMTNSDNPRFKVFVASLAPLRSCLQLAACWTRFKIFAVRAASANGQAFGLTAGSFSAQNETHKLTFLIIKTSNLVVANFIYQFKLITIYVHEKQPHGKHNLQMYTIHMGEQM